MPPSPTPFESFGVVTNEGYWRGKSAFAAEYLAYIYSELKGSNKNNFTGALPDGAMRWVPEDFCVRTPLAETYDAKEFPFVSTNYKPRFRSVSMQANNPIMRDLCASNYLELNLDDAAELGIRDGDCVRITNPTGDVMEGEAKLCNHCADAPCVKVCPTGASWRTDEGVVLLSAFLLVGVVELALQWKTKKTPKWLDVVGVLLAVGVAGYTVMLLGDAHLAFPLWNQMVLPLLFLVSAASAGFAAVVLAGHALHAPELEQLRFTHTTGLVLPVLEAVLIAVLLMMAQAADGSAAAAGAASVAALTSGAYAAPFWLGLVVVGLACPFALELAMRAKPELAAAPAAAALRDDALAVELAFMAYLAACQAWALDGEGADGAILSKAAAASAEQARAWQERFLHDHLLCWVGKAAAVMARTGDDLYTRAALLTEAWCKFDIERVTAQA